MTLPVPTDSSLPGSVARELDVALETLETLWGRLKLGIDSGRRQLEQAIVDAEALEGQPDLAAVIRSAARLATDTERRTFGRRLLSAWPNASQGDLAGFGFQLNEDVASCRPSAYALDAALRQLRRQCKFMPSISEVLNAIEIVDKRTRNVLKTIDKIPDALAEARATFHREVSMLAR